MNVTSEISEILKLREPNTRDFVETVDAGSRIDFDDDGVEGVEGVEGGEVGEGVGGRGREGDEVIMVEKKKRMRMKRS
ncbi:hypothetical protein TSUD_384330 [Trifolium subterraneum]|uniref:Uncharacterized protein n=1 Tax=Trifolium subterraneum TaxID=3900 RepID=A0A2Z6MSQ2_TRISU|nr:hypothetical protein TSUD_384330 [Trifolium subterraneum]